MTYSELQDALARLPNPHPLAETGVLSVVMVGTDVSVKTDTSELEAQIAELMENNAELEKEAVKQDAEVERLEAEIEKAHDALADVKANGATETLRTYMECAKEADDAAARWKEIAESNRRICEEARDELRLLRKRKGLHCGIVMHAPALLRLLNQVADDPKAAPALQTDAKRLREEVLS
jgi:predicted RNase H-like nuclease (RuvC/YqgF family)